MIFALSLLLLSACGSKESTNPTEGTSTTESTATAATAADYYLPQSHPIYNIRLGMSAVEVHDILGEPDAYPTSGESVDQYYLDEYTVAFITYNTGPADGASRVRAIDIDVQSFPKYP